MMSTPFAEVFDPADEANQSEAALGEFLVNFTRHPWPKRPQTQHGQVNLCERRLLLCHLRRVSFRTTQQLGKRARRRGSG